MTSVQDRFQWPTLRVGAMLDGSPIEAVSQMYALSYYGKKDYRVVPDRPLACTAHDVIARVLLVHRCGTDVKIFQSGRPDQAEESLLEELAALIGSPHRGDSTIFLAYVRLLETGQADATVNDPLYQNLHAALNGLDEHARRELWSRLHLHWGRIFGHETVVEIVRVGSQVHTLSGGIGYLQGHTLSADQLDFQPGKRFTLQSRIAHYHAPAVDHPGQSVRGIQQLGGNITDLAMNQAGAFAQYVRIRPQVIRSGSVLPVPDGLDTVSAALVEPLACLLDCFQKSTHELGQDDHGSILRKGVMPGGLTCVIGSGSMAIMAAKLALSDDPIISIGGARKVVFIVRSLAKRDLVLDVMGNDPRVACVICDNDNALPAETHRQFLATQTAAPGRPAGFPIGFDDVILAAGSAATVAAAHRIIAPTGARVMTFAGTRGGLSMESGLWHYANAGVLGTSGCNTKMMEIALGMLARGSLDLRPLSGKTYTFADLQNHGTAAFFEDQHLRPKLDPNAGIPPVQWRNEF